MGEMNHSARKPVSLTIEGLDPWFFWAREDSIGLDDEAVQAMRLGTATDEQVARARVLAMAAKNLLIGAVPCEPYLPRRPS